MPTIHERNSAPVQPADTEIVAAELEAIAGGVAATNHPPSLLPAV
jgi:hypothetical protein